MLSAAHQTACKAVAERTGGCTRLHAVMRASHTQHAAACAEQMGGGCRGGSVSHSICRVCGMITRAYMGPLGAEPGPVVG